MGGVRHLYAMEGADLTRGRDAIRCVGASRYQPDLLEIAGGKTPDAQYIATNAEVWREADNPIDGNAIQVRIAGRVVAYLSRFDADRYSRVMDRAGIEALACPAEIRGGWDDGESEGHFGVVVWLPPPARIGQ